MSTFKAQVTNIVSHENLNIVEFSLGNDLLTMVSLELDERVKRGTTVRLSVKPTNVAIGKDLTGYLSYSNQLSATLIKIHDGQLLSELTLKLSDGTLIESIVTKASAHKLSLTLHDRLTVIIKATNLSILEVLDV